MGRFRVPDLVRAGDDSRLTVEEARHRNSYIAMVVAVLASHS